MSRSNIPEKLETTLRDLLEEEKRGRGERENRGGRERGRERDRGERENRGGRGKERDREREGRDNREKEREEREKGERGGGGGRERREREGREREGRERENEQNRERRERENEQNRERRERENKQNKERKERENKENKEGRERENKENKEGRERENKENKERKKIIKEETDTKREETPSENMSEIKNEKSGFMFVYESEDGVLYNSLDKVLVKTVEGQNVKIFPVYFAGGNDNLTEEVVVKRGSKLIPSMENAEDSWLKVINGNDSNIEILPFDLENVVVYNGQFFHCMDDFLDHVEQFGPDVLPVL